MPATSPRSSPGRRNHIWKRASGSGFQVVIFLLVLSGLLYFTKKKVWHDVHMHPEELSKKS